MFNFLRNWLNRRKCARVGKHVWGRPHAVSIAVGNEKPKELGERIWKRCKICGTAAKINKRVRKEPV